MADGKLPNGVHMSRPWRIHEIAKDFRLEDVWALPTPGGPDDFPRLVALADSFDPTHSSSRLAGLLWAIRLKAGELLGWDDEEQGLVSFTPMYVTEDEYAAEIVNKTVHGILHVGWVSDGDGGYRGEMAVYVKPNGLLGEAYMLAIKPFRHFVVYPPMLRDLGRRWADPPRSPRPGRPAAGTAAPSPGAGGDAASAGA